MALGFRDSLNEDAWTVYSVSFLLDRRRFSPENSIRLLVGIIRAR